MSGDHVIVHLSVGELRCLGCEKFRVTLFPISVELLLSTLTAFLEEHASCAVPGDTQVAAIASSGVLAAEKLLKSRPVEVVRFPAKKRRCLCTWEQGDSPCPVHATAEGAA